MDTREQLIDILSKLFFSGETPQLKDSDSLIESGLVDSLDMMELVSSVEKRFGIKVDIDDLAPENFDSITSLTKYVQSRLE